MSGPPRIEEPSDGDTNTQATSAPPPFKVPSKSAAAAAATGLPQLQLDNDADNDEKEKEEEELTMFPARSSIQRSSGSRATVPSPASGGLKPPPSTTNPPRSLMNYTKPISTPSATPGRAVRAKVALKPGYSAMDWAALRSSPTTNLRGVPPGTPLLRVTPAELARHKSPQDCWTALGGRVYNMTEYRPYHPGGDKILMAVAGKDGTGLFMKTHGWVSFENMLDKCLVGVYCP